MTTGYKHTTKEARAEMVRLYLSGLTAKKAAAALGYQATACLSALKEAGVPRRPIRRLLVDESFFCEIDTEEKAYWLGFLAADGNIGVGLAYLQVALAEKDAGHLVKLKTDLKADHEVKVYTEAGNKVARLYISSVKLVNGLVRSGIVPQKTHTLKPWVGPPDLMRHYWRGYFDGDGSITKTRGQWCFKLAGNQAIVSAWGLYVSEFLESSPPKLQDYGTWCESSVCGNQRAHALSRLLYRDSRVFLDRKMALAENILNTCAVRKRGGQFKPGFDERRSGA